MTTIASLFANYGITGNPTIDTIILAHLIPILVSYTTAIFAFIQNFLSKVLLKNLREYYFRFKRKFLGTVDFRLSVSQEKSIYPAIRNIFFSPVIKSDNIDIKTLGILNLITESKYDNDSYHHWFYDDIYDMSMDESNNINIEKRTDLGTSISKKYFEYDDYYIVISENKKTDFSYIFRQYEKKEEKEKEKEKTKEEQTTDANNNTEHFILFEAIRKSTSNLKNDEIIKKFLYERFKIHIRIPYKYIVKIDDEIMNARFKQNESEIIDGDHELRELTISDGIEKFLSNPKVKQFCGQELNNNSIKMNNSSGISSSLIAKYRGNVFDTENLPKELCFTDTHNNEGTSEVKLFSPSFKSVFKYFFGSKVYDNGFVNYFYFKDNKIVLYFGNRDMDGIVKRYIGIVSFQETIQKENLIEIFSENIIIKKVNKERDDKMRIYNYQNGDWVYTKCKARSYDTIYLPTKMKELITSEMDKFICFEKVFRENGIPYKKGFLFYGPPGTGKTSLVKALAYAYDIPIYIFDINNGLINDENITKIINSISGSGNRILLFEDIDSAFSNKEELKYQ